MSKTLQLIAVFIGCLVGFDSAVAVAGETRNRFWLLWEQFEPVEACNTGEHCARRQRYTTRLLDAPSDADIHRTIGMLDRLALTRGAPVEHPDAPRICQNSDPEMILGFNPERWEISEKLDALRGLQGLQFSVRNLKGPVGYSGSFGQDLQSAIERRFQAAGIRVLSERDNQRTPGRPKLNVYFSNTNAVTGCHYSVFASLSQTVLLTRDINVKLEVGTWSASAGPSDDHPNRTEYDAILHVADQFISDFLEANSANHAAER